MENNENQVVETVETENKPVDPVQKEVEGPSADSFDNCYNMTREEAQKLAEDEFAMKKENERRETLRHKVVADFVIMCSEFLYNEFLIKLKEMEQKDSFFESMKE